MNWMYNDKEILSIEDMPEKTIGFVYILYFSDNSYYFGCKQIISISGKPSNWKSYCGSSKSILQLLKSGELSIVKKEILDFAISKQELLYKETKQILCNGALEDSKSRNGWIKAKIFKTHVIDPKEMTIRKPKKRKPKK